MTNEMVMFNVTVLSVFGLERAGSYFYWACVIQVERVGVIIWTKNLDGVGVKTINYLVVKQTARKYVLHVYNGTVHLFSIIQ